MLSNFQFDVDHQYIFIGKHDIPLFQSYAKLNIDKPKFDLKLAFYKNAEIACNFNIKLSFAKFDLIEVIIDVDVHDSSKLPNLLNILKDRKFVTDFAKDMFEDSLIYDNIEYIIKLLSEHINDLINKK